MDKHQRRIFLHRLTRGFLGGKASGVPLLLLTTTGRKSRIPRTVPLGYFIHDDSYVIVGSNAGRPSHPGWMLNLMQNPYARIQIGGTKMEVVSTLATDEQRDKLWEMAVRTSDLFDGYRKNTSRRIEFAILRPPR